jgi:hypothetical protein
MVHENSFAMHFIADKGSLSRAETVPNYQDYLRIKKNDSFQ